jgi:hypothetical protein
MPLRGIRCVCQEALKKARLIVCCGKGSAIACDIARAIMFAVRSLAAKTPHYSTKAVE